jgi:hypothetical protein
MVSSELKELDQIFSDLKNCYVNISKYKENPIFDALFDIVTTDTYVAGIATTLLNGKSVDRSNFIVVTTKYLRDKKYWIMGDGREIDISEYEEILKYAETIEETRKECYSILKSKMGKLEGL